MNGDEDRREKYQWGRDLALSCGLVPSLMTYLGLSPGYSVLASLATLAGLKLWERFPSIKRTLLNSSARPRAVPSVRMLSYQIAAIVLAGAFLAFATTAWL